MADKRCEMCGKPLIHVKADRRFCGACMRIRRKAYAKQYQELRKGMNHLVEETGDLLITLEQIRIYLVRDGYGDALNSMIDYKLNQELGRMEQERKDNESKAYHNRRKRNPSKG